MSSYSGRLSQQYHHNHSYPPTHKMIRNEKRLVNKINTTKQDALTKALHSTSPTKLNQSVTLTPPDALGTEKLGALILYNKWVGSELNNIRDTMDRISRHPIYITPEILVCVMFFSSNLHLLSAADCGLNITS